MARPKKNAEPIKIDAYTPPTREVKRYQVVEPFTADIADKIISGKRDGFVLLTDNEAEVLLHANKIKEI